jgi:hypothetical protein
VTSGPPDPPSGYQDTAPDLDLFLRVMALLLRDLSQRADGRLTDDDQDRISAVRNVLARIREDRRT